MPLEDKIDALTAAMIENTQIRKEDLEFRKQLYADSGGTPILTKERVKPGPKGKKPLEVVPEPEPVETRPDTPETPQEVIGAVEEPPQEQIDAADKESEVRTPEDVLHLVSNFLTANPTEKVRITALVKSVLVKFNASVVTKIPQANATEAYNLIAAEL